MSRVKYNPGEDLGDAERAIRRFQECMDNRDLIAGDPIDDFVLRLWQRRAHLLGVQLSNLALDLDGELQFRDIHAPTDDGCSCGRSMYCGTEEDLSQLDPHGPPLTEPTSNNKVVDQPA